MNRHQRGSFRPVAYLSSCAVVFLLLAVPAAFSQQPKVTLTPKSQIVSEANDRIAQLAQATSVKQNDYLIGSGDLLTVEVFDVPELSRDVRVSETGYISLPLMPAKVRAEGLTPYQLQDKLAELLQTNGLVSTPQVSVSFVPDVFGLNRRTVESLQAQVQQTRYALAATHITLSSNVAAAAIQEASLRGQIDATRELTAISTNMLQILRNQYQAGYASELDVAGQELQLAQVAATH